MPESIEKETGMEEALESGEARGDSGGILGSILALVSAAAEIVRGGDADDMHYHALSLGEEAAQLCLGMVEPGAGAGFADFEEAWRDFYNRVKGGVSGGGTPLEQMVFGKIEEKMWRIWWAGGFRLLESEGGSAEGAEGAEGENVEGAGEEGPESLGMGDIEGGLAGEGEGAAEPAPADDEGLPGLPMPGAR